MNAELPSWVGRGSRFTSRSDLSTLFDSERRRHQHGDGGAFCYANAMTGNVDVEGDADSDEVLANGRPVCAVCGVATEKEPCMIHMPRAWAAHNADYLDI